MKKGLWFVLSVTLALSMLAGACGGAKATTSATTSAPPPTTTTNPPTTATTIPPATTTTPTSTATGGTLPDIGIPITSHDAAAMKAYGAGTPGALCQMCHAKGLSNSNPYPPTWDGKASGSTKYPGVYTITPGSVQDHTNYKVEDCAKAGCHAGPPGYTPPAATTTAPPTSTTTTPPTSTTTPPASTTPTSTIAAGVSFIDITTDGFNPKTLKAKVGIKITFTNKLEGDETIIIKRGETEVIRMTVLKAKEWEYTFNTVGVYEITLAGEHFEMEIEIVA